MERKDRGILLIVVLFIILFFANIFEAKGQPYTITDVNNLSVIKDFYECSDGAIYAYVKSSQYSSGTFKINYNMNLDVNEGLEKSYAYIIQQDKTGYIKIQNNEISFVSNSSCPITYMDFLENDILTIPSGIILTIPPEINLTVNNIIFQNNNGSLGTLINNGHLGILNDFSMSYGTFINNGILDFNGNVDLQKTSNPHWNFINSTTGEIYCLGGDENNQKTFNVGVNGNGNRPHFDSNYPQSQSVIYFAEGAMFTSNYYNVNFYTNNGTTDLQDFTVRHGDVVLDIQSNAGLSAESIIVDGTITFSGGQYGSVVVNELAMFDFIDNSSSNQFLSITVAPGANVFVKQITSGKPNFTIGNGSSMTLCQNPTKGVADWGNGNYLATLQAGGTFNYIINEYISGNTEKNPTNVDITNSIKGEWDVSVADGLTVEMQRYGETIDENSGIRITSFVQFLRYILSLLSARDEQKVYLNGAFTNIDACNDAYDNHKMEIFLPIELTYFIINGDIFEWETESENNNDYFVVEYSKNGTDWRECTKHIGSKSNTGWVYDCVVPENTKYSQFSYYRLKQVDIDGKYSYSDVFVKSWKVKPPENDCDFSVQKSFINIEGKVIYKRYNQLPSGTYIEKSENGTRKIVKIK